MPTGDGRPERGAGGRRRGFAGLFTATRHHRCGGRRSVRRARAAVPVGGGGAWPGFETTRQSTRQHAKRRRCGGRRRDRRARAGFDAGSGRGAGRRRRGLVGLRGNAPRNISHEGPTGVEGAGGSGGPGCGARGRRRGLAGLRDDAPSEARGADGSRAGRRPRAYKAARPAHAETPPRRCGTGFSLPSRV